jgi:hypothetical protein
VTVRSVLTGSALIVGLALSGCAAEAPGADPSTTPPSPTTSDATDTATGAPTSTTPVGVTIDISLEDGRFTPQGKTIKVPLGEPVTLSITSDVAGELHVHDDAGTPVPFTVGATTKELRFEAPGVIEVEDHDSGVVVVQLEVR